MSTTKTITIRLDRTDYERLAAAAKRQGMSLGALARDYVRASLEGKDDLETEKGRSLGLEALARLAKLTADLPAVDAVQVARESREELERRALIP
ncbi:MAG: ribbon-helix-helix protein, CopG family [Chloroflexi bacterium]|nr:ribbon-helix-helix protein, CopG family [Chloroflexota bacterium]